MGNFRALVLHEEGGKVVPRLETVDEARLPPGEVTVAVEYSTLNYKDGMILEGQGRLVRAYPHVPGVDFAGTVLRSDSPEFRPGDPVILTGWRVGEVQWGGYAERARVKAAYLVRRPDGLSARQAMAIGTAGFTAMLPTPPAAPVTSTSPAPGPASGASPCFSRAMTASMDVKPAVPIAMAWRAVRPAGRRTRKLAGTRARSAYPPQCNSPTRQPVRMTGSPARNSGESEARTVPAKSTPGTCG